MLKILKTYFYPVPFFLLCLYIFFMYTAQDTLLPTWIHSVVMYSMIGTVFLYAALVRKFVITTFSIWYIVFFLFSILSVAFYLQSDPSILFPIFVSLIISFCFIQTINTTDKLEACLNMYVVSAIVMALMILQTGQLDYLFINSIQQERLGTEITGNANILTALFMYAGVFAAWFMIYAERKMSRLIYLLALIFILFIMISSGGRKTIVAVLLTMGLFLIMKGKYDKWKILRNITITIIAIVSFFMIIWNVPLLYELIGERFEGLFDLFVGKDSNVNSDSTREQMFILAIEKWLNRPLLGYGIDSFKFFNRGVTGHFYYAHNNVAELLYDVGIIGFLLFYWIFLHIYKQLKLIHTDEGYKYKVLGFGLLLELFIFDMGGVSYYLVGNIVLLSIAYLCFVLQKI